MIKLPEKIKLANLPTKIEKLYKTSKELMNTNIYIKRDDHTGIEFSGNKIRKLEFTIKEALDKKCDYFITCGALQSNHARATVSVAAKLGLKSYLILAGEKNETIDGNYLINKLLGATIKIIDKTEFKERIDEIMKEAKEKLESEGYSPYIIPLGASNGIGTFGYFEAMQEIYKQEKGMGIKFDAIVHANGSGGTYAGLFLANKLLKMNREIYGISVSSDKEFFKEKISNILKSSFEIISQNIEFENDEIKIIDEYVGKGYGESREEEINFIKKFAELEGIILDPVYTGKAMYGLINEIKNGNMGEHKNILFIHTGGIYSIFSKKHLFNFK